MVKCSIFDTRNKNQQITVRYLDNNLEQLYITILQNHEYQYEKLNFIKISDNEIELYGKKIDENDIELSYVYHVIN